MEKEEKKPSALYLAMHTHTHEEVETLSFYDAVIVVVTATLRTVVAKFCCKILLMCAFVHNRPTVSFVRDAFP